MLSSKCIKIEHINGKFNQFHYSTLFNKNDIKVYLFCSPDADVYDYIRAEIGERMVDRMFDVTKECKKVAELGCNRGFITRHELPEGIEEFYLCDSSEVALKQAKAAVKPDAYKVKTIQMDEEAPNVSFFIFKNYISRILNGN